MRRIISTLCAVVFLLTTMAVGGIVWTSAATSGYYTYTIENGGATITKYSGSAATLNVPSVLNGYAVTAIGDRAFQNCASIHRAVLPAGLVTVGDYAFENCASLKEVLLPSSVKSLGDAVWQSCSSFRDVYYGGTQTERAAISMGINNATATEAVWYYNVIGFRTSGDYTYAACTDSTAVITAYKGTPTEHTIPSDLDGYAVTTIGNSAFRDGDTLVKLTVPEGVTTIGMNAFRSCNALSEVVIPSSVRSIGGYSFYDCTALAEIAVPSGVTFIGEQAFFNCNSLQAVHITDVAAWCSIEMETSLSNPLFSGEAALLLNGQKPVEVIIPDGVTTIADGAFHNCDRLQSVVIPDSVTSIRSYAFDGCSSLTDITVPSGVSVIGDAAFSGCVSLTSLAIPDGVTAIGGYTFYNCAALKRLTLPDGVTAIGEGAFYNCAALTALTMPRSLTSIGDYAFYGCEALTPVHLPDGVTAIGDLAFHGCTSLAGVMMPSTVSHIGYAAFSDCPMLTDIYYRGDEAAWTAVTVGEDNTALTDATVHFLADGSELDAPLLGDLVADEELDMRDAFALYSAVSGDAELTEEQQTVADVNDDGEIDMRDAFALYMMVSGG